jgi:hypothetical protein
LITIGELNATQIIKDILNQLKRESFSQVKDYALNKLGDSVSGMLSRALNSYLPTTNTQLVKNALKKVPGADEPFLALEKVFAQGICDLLGDFGDLWFGVPLSKNGSGTPLGNGVSCDDAKTSGSPPNGQRLSADYLIKPTEPIRRQKDGWIIGDVKFSVKTLYESYLTTGGYHQQQKQWNAISRYAKNYQYVPVTFFITWNHGAKGKKYEESLMQDAAKKGVVMIIFSFT